MKVRYYPETDSLYIEVSEAASGDSSEAEPDIVLDFDASGNVVGIDVDHASSKVDLSRLEADSQALAARFLQGTSR